MVDEATLDGAGFASTRCAVRRTARPHAPCPGRGGAVISEALSSGGAIAEPRVAAPVHRRATSSTWESAPPAQDSMGGTRQSPSHDDDVTKESDHPTRRRLEVGKVRSESCQKAVGPRALDADDETRRRWLTVRLGSRIQSSGGAARPSRPTVAKTTAFPADADGWSDASSPRRRARGAKLGSEAQPSDTGSRRLSASPSLCTSHLHLAFASPQCPHRVVTDSTTRTGARQPPSRLRARCPLPGPRSEDHSGDRGPRTALDARADTHSRTRCPPPGPMPAPDVRSRRRGPKTTPRNRGPRTAPARAR